MLFIRNKVPQTVNSKPVTNRGPLKNAESYKSIFLAEFTISSNCECELSSWNILTIISELVMETNWSPETNQRKDSRNYYSKKWVKSRMKLFLQFHQIFLELDDLFCWMYIYEPTGGGSLVWIFFFSLWVKLRHLLDNIALMYVLNSGL